MWLTIGSGINREWSKAKSRRDRWAEEVELLKEEMRRVLESLKHDEAVWLARADMKGPENETSDVSSGRVAFCLAQANGRKLVRESFLALWLRQAPPRGKQWDALDTLRFKTICDAVRSTGVHLYEGTSADIGRPMSDDDDD